MCVKCYLIYMSVYTCVYIYIRIVYVHRYSIHVYILYKYIIHNIYIYIHSSGRGEQMDVRGRWRLSALGRNAR